jgi:hypothetical protein
MFSKLTLAVRTRIRLQKLRDTSIRYEVISINNRKFAPEDRAITNAFKQTI